MDKQIIGLVATKIEFTYFSIIYHVELENGMLGMFDSCIAICPLDVANKDLIIKPTIISNNQLKVVYTPNNVTPQFYQNLIDKSINNYTEYKTQLNDIYLIGDIVGYILI